MSYEGYEQCLCVKGHLYIGQDLYDFSDPCPVCQSPAVWVNCVDDTNCESYGYIPDFSSLRIKEAQVETCNLGHVHLVSPAIYRVPTEEEHARLRCYRNNNKFKPLLQ